MKKWLGIIFGIIILFVIAIYAFLQWKSEPIPPSTDQNPKEYIEKVYEATNKTLWDSIPYVKWSFRNTNHYVWNKKDQLVQVKWDEYTAFLDLRAQNGVVYDSDGKITPNQSKHIQKAIDLFNNDSFWLCAHTKLEDPGTRSSLINDNGKIGLKISYTKGGSTPGDTYVWYWDEKGFPCKFKMWVSILPLKGAEATWEKWEQLYNGAWISTYHKLSFLEITIDNLQAGETLSSIGKEADLFSVIQ